MISPGRLHLFFVLLTVLPVAVRAQSTSAIDRYITSSPVARIPLSFPGPFGGYMFAHFPVEQIGELGDTTVKTKAFLVDMNISHDGIFLSPDTLKTTADAVPFVFSLSRSRAIHARLAPTHVHENFRGYDSSYSGSIGYGLLQKYVTAFDFKTNELRFYPLFTEIGVPEKDGRVLALPLIDDALLTYCHCPYPTIWMDVVAPPLKPGRVQLATQEPISQIFEDALDTSTRRALATESTPNEITGQKPKVGLNVSTFKVGGRNIAKFSAHRAVDPMPDAFKDLTVTVLGTLGTDVLRTFSGLVIDPSRQAIYLIR